MEEAYEIVDKHIDAFLVTDYKQYSPQEVLEIMQAIRREINDTIINNI